MKMRRTMVAAVAGVGLALLACPRWRLRAEPPDLNALLETKAVLAVTDALLEEAIGQLDAQVPALDLTVSLRNTEKVRATLIINGPGLPLRDILRCIAALGGGNLYQVGNRLVLANPADLTDEERSQAVVVGAGPADWLNTKQAAGQRLRRSL